MAELTAKTPYETVTGGASGAERMEVAPFVLVEIDPGPMTEIAPYIGAKEALSEALTKAHGLQYPDPNHSSGQAGAEVIWFGHSSAMMFGITPDPALGEFAALTDQSDGWSAVELSGPDADEVLARLVPIDLRAAHFDVGDTARTQLNHMSTSITRTSPECFRILVFRSMVKTLFRELHHAMIGVCARRIATRGG